MTNLSNLNQRAKAVFMAALEKESPELRNQYLDEACADEPELRHEVVELLGSLKQADSFMENKPRADLGQTAMHNTDATLVGETIGPYKLLEEIGEGGMGSVWVAQQSEPIKRKVAIKLIKAGMDSKSVLARFEAERQALAMMDHPNIARVLDGGMTEQGRPYFAMEYVKGFPLTEYCDQAKLSVKERLQLFLPICQAVQHAHQKGIIHRDLKPSNILICLYDGKPVPKVIDFGLAKAMYQSLTDKSLYTSHGMMLGTPLYMSPEQAESNNLDIDTRTDIYSLGVILYELLTGSTPLEKAQVKQAAFNEILRLIKDVEAPKPSTRLSGSASLPSVAAQRSIAPAQLQRSITGDLDWVVMKALEKERGHRYETANGLAADIRRHLADEPVTASPPSRRYRMQKFITRNRASVIAGSAVVIALLLGVVGTTTGMFWALTEKSAAVAARQTENEAKQKANTSAALANTEAARAAKAQAAAERNRRDAEVQRYAADIGLADAAIREGNLFRARSLLEALKAEGIVSESPPFEWCYLMERARGDYRDAIAGTGHSIWALTVSPNNSMLAYVDSTADIQIVDRISKMPLANIAQEMHWEGIEFTADGSGLMVWSVSKRTLLIYDSQSWLERLRLTNIIGPPSPDGRLVVRRVADEELAYVHEIEEQRDLGSVPTDATWIQVIEEGEWVLVADKGNKWFINGAKLVRLSQPGEIILPKSIAATTACNPGLRQFAVGDGNGNVTILDLESGKTVRKHAVVDQKRAAVDTIAVSPDGDLIAAATWEPALTICDLKSGEQWNLGRLESEVWTMAFAPDGRSLITGDKDGQIRIWDINRAVERTTSLLLPNPVPHLRIPTSPDGALLAVSYRENPDEDSEIRIYDTTNLSVKSTITTTGIPLKFIDNGRQLVTIGRDNISYWDVLSRKRNRQISIKRFESELAPGRALISWDGSCVVVPDGTDQIRIHNLQDGRLIQTINDVKLRSGIVALSRDNTILAVEHGSSIDVYELASGRPIMTLKNHRGSLHSIEFSANGGGLIAGSHGDLLYWDLETGKSTELHGHRNYTIKAVAVTDDGQTAASLGHDYIKLWNVETKRELAAISWLKESYSAVIQFEADGRILIAHEHTMQDPIQSRIQIWRNSSSKESR